MILEKVVTKGAGGAAALVIKNALKKGCSFEGDTEVLMADGSTEPIESIEVGDQVLATDPETGEQEAKAVEAKHVHDDILVTLVLIGARGMEETVRTTEDHPFWSATDREFQRADALSPGELVLGSGGETVEVARIDRDVTWEPAWNLTVDGLHTYHVLTNPDRGPPGTRDAADVQESGILVHNCGTGARSGEGLSDDELLASAQALRDDHVAEVVRTSSKRKMAGAVTAGYNIETREFAAGNSSAEGGCAEICVVNQLGGDATKIRFTAAIRARHGGLQEICPACEITFRRHQFVDPATTFQTDRILGGE
jgi:hypothetical protein